MDACNECQKKASWWVSDGPKRAWVPRCGNHARMPPFTARQRIPISEPRPEHFTRLGDESPSQGREKGE